MPWWAKMLVGWLAIAAVAGGVGALIAGRRSATVPAEPAPVVAPPPQLEVDEDRPSAETLTLVSSSSTVAVMRTIADAERLRAIALDVVAHDAGNGAIDDFLTAAHAVAVLAGTEAKLVAEGAEWFQVSVQMDGRWRRGFVVRYQVRRAAGIPPIAHTEVRVDHDFGHDFHVLTVPHGATWSQVTDLAIYLHKRFPELRYEIQDAAVKEQGAILNAYGAADRPCFKSRTCAALRWGIGASASAGFKGAGCDAAGCSIYWLEP